jgi:hypothetical protein
MAVMMMEGFMSRRSLQLFKEFLTPLLIGHPHDDFPGLGFRNVFIGDTLPDERHKDVFPGTCRMVIRGDSGQFIEGCVLPGRKGERKSGSSHFSGGVRVNGSGPLVKLIEVPASHFTLPRHQREKSHGGHPHAGGACLYAGLASHLAFEVFVARGALAVQALVPEGEGVVEDE